jgi:hypothetical protein
MLVPALGFMIKRLCRFFFTHPLEIAKSHRPGPAGVSRVEAVNAAQLHGAVPEIRSQL